MTLIAWWNGIATDVSITSLQILLSSSAVHTLVPIAESASTLSSLPLLAAEGIATDRF